MSVKHQSPTYGSAAQAAGPSRHEPWCRVLVPGIMIFLPQHAQRRPRSNLPHAQVLLLRGGRNCLHRLYFVLDSVKVGARSPHASISLEQVSPTVHPQNLVVDAYHGTTQRQATQQLILDPSQRTTTCQSKYNTQHDTRLAPTQSLTLRLQVVLRRVSSLATHSFQSAIATSNTE